MCSFIHNNSGQSRNLYVQFKKKNHSKSSKFTESPTEKYPACKRYRDEEYCPVWEWECFSCGTLGHTSKIYMPKSKEQSLVKKC